MKVKCVAFDFGGVIAEEGFYNGMKAIALRFGLDPEETVDMAFRLVFEAGFVEGGCTEDELWDLFRKETGISARDRDLREMVLSRFIVRPWMLQLARSLREDGIITAMLTDQTEWLKELDGRAPFLDLFDPVLNSWDTGKTKKDPSSFTDLASAVGLKPEEILFIDDNEGNVERASTMGLETILYRDRESFEKEMDTKIFKALTVNSESEASGDGHQDAGGARA
ncbi:MAG TPA: HAD family phosphatase [Synergistales bacterium]|nr:HAD family phosphatase [Synergistales bacterium]